MSKEKEYSESMNIKEISGLTAEQIVLKPKSKKTITITLEEYSKLIKSDIEVMLLKNFIKTAQYSCEIATFVRNLLEEKTLKKGEQNELS